MTPPQLAKIKIPAGKPSGGDQWAPYCNPSVFVYESELLLETGFRRQDSLLAIQPGTAIIVGFTIITPDAADFTGHTLSGTVNPPTLGFLLVITTTVTANNACATQRFTSLDTVNSIHPASVLKRQTSTCTSAKPTPSPWVAWISKGLELPNAARPIRTGIESFMLTRGLARCRGSLL